MDEVGPRQAWGPSGCKLRVREPATSRRPHPSHPAAAAARRPPPASPAVLDTHASNHALFPLQVHQLGPADMPGLPAECYRGLVVGQQLVAKGRQGTSALNKVQVWWWAGWLRQVSKPSGHASALPALPTSGPCGRASLKVLLLVEGEAHAAGQGTRVQPLPILSWSCCRPPQPCGRQPRLNVGAAPRLGPLPALLQVLLCCVRLPHVGSDVLITLNSPIFISERSAAAEHAGARSSMGDGWAWGGSGSGPEGRAGKEQAELPRCGWKASRSSRRSEARSRAAGMCRSDSSPSPPPPDLPSSLPRHAGAGYKGVHLTAPALFRQILATFSIADWGLFDGGDGGGAPQ